MVLKKEGNVSAFLLRCLLIICLDVSSTIESEFGFRFVTWPSWQVATAGDEITLGCTTNLKPDTIRWQHNHQYIKIEGVLSSSSKAGEKIQVTEDGSKGSNLILKISEHPQENRIQGGLYQCVASVGSISLTSLPGLIKIAYMKPFSRSTPSTQHIEIKNGNVFRVPCERPDSIPEATLRFYKDGQLLDLEDSKNFHVTRSGDLVVLNATELSAGQYSCKAYNSFLQETIEYAGQSSVFVKEINGGDKTALPLTPPRLVSFDSVINAVKGDRIQLLCLTIDEFPSVLQWHRRGSETPLGDEGDGNAVVMVIREVSANDEGVYRCHGYNSMGSSFVDVSLFVQEPPYIMKGPDSHSVSEESSLNLECIFGGKPAPTVAWVFNGKLLVNSKSLRVFDNRLELYSVEKNQAGIYQCFGFNPFGSAEDTAIVTVIPKTVTASPITNKTSDTISLDADLLSARDSDKTVEKARNEKKKNGINKIQRKNKKKNFRRKMIAPTRPNITKISDESVMVTWDVEPGKGIPILFFKVQYRTLASTDQELVDRRWMTIDEDIPSYVKSFEVTGLHTDHMYRFRVLAVYINNDNQPGPSSKKFFLDKEIKLKPPELAPEILSLVSEDDTSLTIYWAYHAKSITEGFIISYREATSAVDYTKITLLGHRRLNYTVTHLQSNSPYDFRMRSFNMAGTSAFSERKSFYPKGVNFTSDVELETTSSTVVPVVHSDREWEMSNRILYISLASLLGLLLLIVIVSYVIYSCRSKNSSFSGDETTSVNKFMDTSLRIHRLSTGDIRQHKQNGCNQCQESPENQVPLLEKNADVKKSNENTSQQVLPADTNGSGKGSSRNGSVNVLKETSFTGSDQPSTVYRENSLHSTFKR